MPYICINKRLLNWPIDVECLDYPGDEIPFTVYVFPELSKKKSISISTNHVSVGSLKSSNPIKIWSDVNEFGSNKTLQVDLSAKKQINIIENNNTTIHYIVITT